MSRNNRGNSRRRSGIAARQNKSRQQSTSARLRASNTGVSCNDHGSALKRIKQIKYDLHPYCENCGRSLKREDYSGTIYGDHKVPVSQGGQTTMGNIELLCFKCHSDKPGSKNRAGRSLLKANNKRATKQRRTSHESSKTKRGESWRNYG